jgi:hypothetical protein
MIWGTTLMKIEDLWHALRGEAIEAQRRVDADHPLDIYADFEPPARPGIIVLCPTRPPDYQSFKSICIERRERHDGRWTLRVSLEEPKLIGVFTELCRDIVDSTRTGIDPARAGSIVLARIDRWRALFLAESAGLDRSAQRGLIGELLVLENTLLQQLGPDEAVSSWTGPLGMAQDFRLPSGLRIEVKAIERDADKVLINGLNQLDGGGDPLRLAVVRLEDTGRQAPDALTVHLLVARLRLRFADWPCALRGFENMLRFVGWDDAQESGQVVVRLVRIDEYEVDDNFPRLIPRSVPSGIVDATYKIALPTR